MTGPERALGRIETEQKLVGLSAVNASEPDGGLRCSLCPGRSVCLSLRRALSLQLDYDDVAGALDCLEDVLDAQSRISLGRKRFCAYHAEDGAYYLVCREYAVLRLTPAEAHCLREQLKNALEILDSSSARRTLPSRQAGRHRACHNDQDSTWDTSTNRSGCGGGRFFFKSTSGWA